MISCAIYNSKCEILFTAEVKIDQGFLTVTGVYASEEGNNDATEQL